MSVAIDKSIVERLRRLREINKISLDDLAKKIDVGESTIKFIETGRYPVSADMLVKLCKFYRVSADYILGLVDIDLTAYEKETRECYQNSYEQYLRYRQRPGNSLQNIKGKDPIATWPYNLFEYCELDLDAPISDIQMDGLKHVIDKTLTIREGVMVCAYFMKEMTLDDLAKEFGVTRERIRQVISKACRKIKHPARANLILHGANYIAVNKELAEVNAKLAEIAEKKKIIESCGEEFDERYSKAIAKIKEDPLNTTLDDLDLSVRSYNCIRRYFFRSVAEANGITVKDIIPLFQSGEIVKVRNLGRKSCEEIRNRLIEIGIPSEELTPIGGLFNVGA